MIPSIAPASCLTITARRTALALLLALCPAPLLALNTSLADHGATGDGKTMNTGALQAAIDACATAGGGTVTIPTGTWLTGTVELKSRVTLNLEPGAILLGSPRFEDYPVHRFQHLEFKQTRSLLYAIDATDIRITGDGTIDLNGDPFFQWDKINSGLPPEQEATLSEAQRKECTVHSHPRPVQPVFFHNCDRVRVDSVRIRNSPCWTLSFSCCRDVQARGLLIDNNPQAPNNDGIHFSGSKDIIVSDCIIRGGDDSLAFTGITDPDSVCERITVTNCTLSSRSSAIRLGHLSGKIRDVVIGNVVIHHSNRGIAIKAGAGGWVENVLVHDVVMDTRIYAGAWWGKGEPFVISAANHPDARIRGIRFHNVRARSESSGVIIGAARNVSDVSFREFDLTLRPGPNRPLYGRAFDISPEPNIVHGLPDNRLPWLYAESVADLDIRDVRARTDAADKSGLDVSPVLKDVGEAP